MILTGCSTASTGSQESQDKKRFNNYNQDLIITTDNKSGCKYIIFSGYNEGGITPLLKADGTPDCESKSETE